MVGWEVEERRRTEEVGEEEISDGDVEGGEEKGLVLVLFWAMLVALAFLCRQEGERGSIRGRRDLAVFGGRMRVVRQGQAQAQTTLG